MKNLLAALIFGASGCAVSLDRYDLAWGLATLSLLVVLWPENEKRKPPANLTYTYRVGTASNHKLDYASVKPAKWESKVVHLLVPKGLGKTGKLVLYRGTRDGKMERVPIFKKQPKDPVLAGRSGSGRRKRCQCRTVEIPCQHGWKNGFYFGR